MKEQSKYPPIYIPSADAVSWARKLSDAELRWRLANRTGQNNSKSIIEALEREMRRREKPPPAHRSIPPQENHTEEDSVHDS